MCEIFPEVENCCLVASIRVGMLLIGVLAITTGAITLGLIEATTNINYDNLLSTYNNVSNITDSKAALSNLRSLIASAVSGMSVIFMFAGMFLIFSTLSDQEGFAQLFVWMVFLNIFVGFILILAIAFECVVLNRCLLGGMDWLSAAATLIMFGFYLLLWFYYCMVANSYVLNGYQ